jgi:hypothetical protein
MQSYVHDFDGHYVFKCRKWKKARPGFEGRNYADVVRTGDGST